MTVEDWSAPTLHRGVDAEPSAGSDGSDGLDDSAADAVHSALATGVASTVGADPVGWSPVGGDPGGWSATVVHRGRDDGGGAWGAVTYAGDRRNRPRTAGAHAAEPHAAEPHAAEPHAAEPHAAEPDVASTTVEPHPAGGPHATVEPAAAAPADDVGSNRRLFSSSRTMAIASLVSRVTGLLRTAAIAAALGSAATSISNSYNTANSLPNMVYELLVGGVLSSVLIPLIVYAQEHDRDGGEAYTQRLLSIATAALGLATLLAVLAAPWITDLVMTDAAARSVTTVFATLLLPEIFFYGVGALIMAVLNSRNVYGAPAWAPVLNNVVVIVTLVVFVFLPGGTPTLGSITDLQILVLGIGTTLGIVAQAVVLLPVLRRSGFAWQWRFRATGPAENERLREVRTLALWVLAYVAASQVGVVVIQRVGNSRELGYTTFLNADLLFQVPYGILGVSLLTALMPRMSRAAANGDLRAVVADFSLGARLSAVALIPITFGLIVLGPSLTTSILVGRFSADRAHFVGVVLAMAAFGLLPFAIVMLQMRVFYAMRDTRTPTLINLGMVGSKVVLVLLATVVFHSDVHVVEALSVATSLSYVVGMVVGHVLLHRRLGALGLRAVGVTVARVAVASAAGAVVAGLVVWGLHSAIAGPRLASVTSLLLGSALGGAVMIAVAWRMHVPELRDVVAAVRPSGPAGPEAEQRSTAGR